MINFIAAKITFSIVDCSFSAAEIADVVVDLVWLQKEYLPADRLCAAVLGDVGERCAGNHTQLAIVAQHVTKTRYIINTCTLRDRPQIQGPTFNALLCNFKEYIYIVNHFIDCLHTWRHNEHVI